MKNQLSDWYVASVPQPRQYPNRGWLPCIEWCRSEFGSIQTTNIYQGHSWCFVGEGVFEFKRPEHRTAFLLRWS